MTDFDPYEEARKRRRVSREELETIARQAEDYAVMRQTAGWAHLVRQMLRVKDELTRRLVRADEIREVGFMQGQLAHLQGVLDVVDRMVENGRKAHERLAEMRQEDEEEAAWQPKR